MTPINPLDICYLLAAIFGGLAFRLLFARLRGGR